MSFQMSGLARRDMLGAAAAALTMLSASSRPALAASTEAKHAHPILGDATAPKRLIMWGSLTCPFTAVLTSMLMRMQQDLPTKMAVEWHHFPTHRPDPALHVASMSFDGARYWKFAMEILRRVFVANGEYKGLTETVIKEVAVQAGGTAAQVDAAWKRPELWAFVKQDFIAGKLMGISKTPGLFFNGYFLTPDGIPQDAGSFDRELRKMISA
jgi:protein-disulfide isomerase